MAIVAAPEDHDGRWASQNVPSRPEGNAHTRLTRAAEVLVLPAHAKLNLDLAVLGVRPDGHHEIRTRFQAISLHDLLVVAPATETSTLTVAEVPLSEADWKMRVESV